MKVAQNDETNPDTQPVCPPRVPSIANLQPPPSDSSVRKRETPGILSQIFSPFAGITYPCVRSPLAPRIAMLCFAMLRLLFYLLCSPPLLLFGRPRDRCRYPCDRLHRRRTLLARATRQAPPPLITRYRLFLLYTACIRVV